MPVKILYYTILYHTIPYHTILYYTMPFVLYIRHPRCLNFVIPLDSTFVTLGVISSSYSTLGCSDFDCFSQIWNADTSHVFLRAQGLRIWRKNCFWFSHLLRIFWLPNLQLTFLHMFQKCTTRARINRFFSKFPRVF